MKKLLFLSIALLFSSYDYTGQQSVDKKQIDQLQAQEDCIFCNIIARKAPATIIAENDDVIVFKSHSGHPLIVPKKHIKDLRAIEPEDKDILLKLVQAAQALSANSEKPGDFKFLINTGSQAAQTVFHLHVHYFSKSKLQSKTIQI